LDVAFARLVWKRDPLKNIAHKKVGLSRSHPLGNELLAYEKPEEASRIAVRFRLDYDPHVEAFLSGVAPHASPSRRPAVAYDYFTTSRLID